ncbi:MAG: acetate--CoA ligase, partial [Candidatus Brocadiales bacterium]
MTEKEVITKSFPNPCLADYEETYRNFSCEHIEKSFEHFSPEKVNIAFNAIDKHAASSQKDKVALYWKSAQGQTKKYTFLDMKIYSDKVGTVLRKLGVKNGDRVFVFLPRIPELYISIIGIAKIGAVAGPMFSAFGPEAIRDRLKDSEAKVLITTPELKKRIDVVRNELPHLEHILIVGAKNNLAKGEVSYETALSDVTENCEIEWVDAETPLYMLYTSGTTGRPKGVVHVHNDMVSHYITTRWVLDLRDGDVYWCTADPGWVTGTVYGIWGPWLNGESQVVFEDRFDAGKWYSIIQDYKVTVWYTAPTALRMLMKAGEEIIKRYDLSSLRYICSVGEPLNPEVIRWGMEVYNLPIHDNWWQTETGSIMIANYPCLPIKPGSMGKPFPGIKAAIVDNDGNELPTGKHGFLALKPGWPSIMRTIWRDEDRYKAYFQIPGWYTSGDTAYKDEDGYYWFVGRADDVIKTSGHRVGPFEVENALVEHKAVAEAGVIGKPDEQRGEIIKAFIVLRHGFSPSNNLKKDIEV